MKMPPEANSIIHRLNIGGFARQSPTQAHIIALQSIEDVVLDTEFLGQNSKGIGILRQTLAAEAAIPAIYPPTAIC